MTNSLTVIRKSCYGKNAGFTLMELLVVIAIIALLLAIMMPALTRAHALMERLLCVNNARQLALANVMYGGENEDKVVLGRTLGAPRGAPMWDILLCPYLGIKLPSGYDITKSWRDDGTNHAKLSNVSGFKIFTCPTTVNRSTNIITYGDWGHSRTHWTNGLLTGGYTGMGTKNGRDSVKQSKIRQPAKTVLLSEIGCLPINSDWAVVSNGWWVYHTLPRHGIRGLPEGVESGSPFMEYDTRGTTTSAFIDGHAESVPTYAEAGNLDSDKAWELARWLKFHPTRSVNRGNSY